MPRIMHGHSFLPLSISLCCRGEVVVDDSPPRLFSLSRNGRFKLYASSSNPPNRSTRDAVPPPRNACYRFLVDTRQRIIAVGIAKTRKWEETSGYRGERERKDRPWWCAAVDVRGRRRTGGGDLFIDRRTWKNAKRYGNPWAEAVEKRLLDSFEANFKFSLRLFNVHIGEVRMWKKKINKHWGTKVDERSICRSFVISLASFRFSCCQFSFPVL